MTSEPSSCVTQPCARARLRCFSIHCALRRRMGVMLGRVRRAVFKTEQMSYAVFKTEQVSYAVFKTEQVLACGADRQTNMQMNQPVWFVEDKKLVSSEEGKKKLQELADPHSQSSQRLTIVHGGDFDKVAAILGAEKAYNQQLYFPLARMQLSICSIISLCSPAFVSYRDVAETTVQSSFEHVDLACLIIARRVIEIA